MNQSACEAMESRKGLDKLFFELASESRLGLLHELQSENIRMQELARRLELTDTETCRQLQRLSEARLVQKQPDGLYKLTTYARLVLDASSHMDFIFKNMEYFQDHDVFLLPPEFRARLGELFGARLIRSTVETLNWVCEMFKNAEKKIDGVVVGMETMLDIELQRLNEGLKVRWLLHESYLPRAKLKLQSLDRLPEMRWASSLHGHVGITDKAAVLTIKHNDGTWSYDAFVGEDPAFIKYAEDLFMHEWEKAKPWHP
jgi:predicted transcriptional regulator